MSARNIIDKIINKEKDTKENNKMVGNEIGKEKKVEWMIEPDKNKDIERMTENILESKIDTVKIELNQKNHKKIN